MKRPRVAPLLTSRGRWSVVVSSGFLCCLLSFATVGATVFEQPVSIEHIDTRPGAAVYLANCASCHQMTGAGLKRAVPPLAGTVPALLAEPGGRDYLKAVLLNGLSGRLISGGEPYDGLMPSWRHLSDAQLASVMNYLATAWDNADALPPRLPAFTPLEVSLERGQVKRPAEVLRMRP